MIKDLCVMVATPVVGSPLHGCCNQWADSLFTHTQSNVSFWIRAVDIQPFMLEMNTIGESFTPISGLLSREPVQPTTEIN